MHISSIAFKQAAAASLAALFLAACGSGSSEPETPPRPGPDDAALEEAASVRFQGAIEVIAVEVESTENLGSETDPRIQSRGKVTIRLTEPRYDFRNDLKEDVAPLGLEFQPVFVSEVMPAGAEHEVYGLVRSQRQGDGWVSQWNFERLNLKGWPKKRFETATDIYFPNRLERRVIVRGTPESDEVDRLIDERKATLRAKQAEQEKKSLEEAKALYGRFVKLIDERNGITVRTSLTGGFREEVRMYLDEGANGEPVIMADYSLRDIVRPLHFAGHDYRNEEVYLVVKEPEPTAEEMGNRHHSYSLRWRVWEKSTGDLALGQTRYEDGMTQNAGYR